MNEYSVISGKIFQLLLTNPSSCILGVNGMTCWNCTTENPSSDCATGAAPTLLTEVEDILSYTTDTKDEVLKISLSS